MTLGLRARMVVTAAAATAAALLVVHFLAEPDLRRRTLEETRTTLFAEARLMAMGRAYLRFAEQNAAG